MTYKKRVSTFRSSFDTLGAFVAKIERDTQAGKAKALRENKVYKPDNGIVGDAFEVTLREYIQPFSRRNNGRVTPANSKYGDMRLGNSTVVEIKCHCGELNKKALGNDVIFPGADLIIYCPEIDYTIPLEHQSFVFTRPAFLEMAYGYKGRGQLLRTKGDSNNGTLVVSFQSFYAKTRQGASQSMAKHLWDHCYDRPTVAEWVNEL